MPDPTQFLKQLGGPFGLLFFVIVGLAAEGKIDEHGAEVLLAWYVTAGGLGLAGRLPIHVYGCKYWCRDPLKEEDPDRRRLLRRLNLLLLFEFLSILAWAAVAVYLHLTDDSMVVRSAVCVALWCVVIGLAAWMVYVASELGLERGSEWICKSPVGRGFEWLDNVLPSKPPFSWVLPRIKDRTPENEVSAFLVLVSCVLLTFPAGGFAGTPIGRWIRGGSPAEKQAGEADGQLYEDQCKGLPLPGTGAPSPQREQLNALWLGNESLGIDGEGSEQAGCTHRAEPVTGQSGVYYELGFCGSSLRSFGLSSPERDYAPALLYEPAASFALQLANEGVLIGASHRHGMRGGDFYLADTTDGSWLLIRSRTTNGNDEESEGSLPCERVAANNVPYELIPPGLVNVMEQMMTSEQWAWPEQVALQSDGTGEFTLRGEDPAAPPVAVASCPSITFCTARTAAGAQYTTTGSLYTTVEGIEEMAR